MTYNGESRLKRPLPDSNRGWRICNPLPYRLAKGPADPSPGILLRPHPKVNPAGHAPAFSFFASASIRSRHSFRAAVNPFTSTRPAFR
jgi:hypothetical protein